MKRVISVILVVMVVSFACKKDKKDTSNTAPTIELLSASPLEVLQFDSLVTITIKYVDLEGDIGEVDADNHSLEIKDARLNAPDYYHIPPQTPNNQQLDIEGVFQINPNALFILGNAKEETTTYTIKIRDRAGNWSNEVVTSPIVIKDSI